METPVLAEDVLSLITGQISIFTTVFFLSTAIHYFLLVWLVGWVGLFYSLDSFLFSAPYITEIHNWYLKLLPVRLKKSSTKW